MQKLLTKYTDKPLPRAISLFIGNIAAAKKNQRRRDDQDDYNRIWPGSHHNDSAEKDKMQSFLLDYFNNKERAGYAIAISKPANVDTRSLEKLWFKNVCRNFTKPEIKKGV